MFKVHNLTTPTILSKLSSLNSSKSKRRGNTSPSVSLGLIHAIGVTAEVEKTAQKRLCLTHNVPLASSFDDQDHDHHHDNDHDHQGHGDIEDRRRSSNLLRRNESVEKRRSSNFNRHPDGDNAEKRRSSGYHRRHDDDDTRRSAYRDNDNNNDDDDGDDDDLRCDRDKQNEDDMASMDDKDQQLQLPVVTLEDCIASKYCDSNHNVNLLQEDNISTNSADHSRKPFHPHYPSEKVFNVALKVYNRQLQLAWETGVATGKI